MSYGQNQPWGLMAVKTTTGAPWNGQTSQYLIQSGYTFNIFKGDLVYLDTTGYIHALADLSGFPLLQSIGVFNGCSFATSTATNPIDPASPGRPYWPARTVTLNAVPATCDIIDDPSVIFNIQSGVTGVPFNGQGDTASVVWGTGSTPGTSPGAVGNTNTGASSMMIDATTIGDHNAARNLRILRFVPVSGNTSDIPYNNVEVLIQNHSFASRPAGL